MIRAVIADDEHAAAIVVRNLIQKSGMPVEIVGESMDGESALEMIRTINPDLVFLDIQMPCMNGFEIIKKEPNRKYIIITAYESFQYAQQALRMGAKDILLKPVEYESFCRAVSNAIGWKFTKSNLTNDIIEYIQNNYSQNVYVNHLAQIHYTTASHIARTFKKNMGIGVISYLHSVRIKHAVEMIETTDMGIKEIATACGYENLNNFYKYFKQVAGCTPAAYRDRRAQSSPDGDAGR